MKQSKIPLNDMALFVEVGSALNIRKTAQLTGIPSSTISRRINQLENTIGLRLLNRTTRSIEFTEAGQLYFDQLKPIIEKINITHEKLSSLFTQPKGVLKACLPVDFTNKFIAPLLPEFCELYPNITFDFDLSAKDINNVDHYYDVAIRLGVLPHQFISWAKQQNIRIEYIQPGKPQQNAYIERHNRTIRFSWVSKHLFDSLEQVQNYATKWLWFYNHERPHKANGGRPPLMAA